MKLNELALIGVAAATIVSCSPVKKEYASYELYPVRSGDLTEMEYTPEVTNFTLWAPTADEVRLCCLIPVTVVMLMKPFQWWPIRKEPGQQRWKKT